MSQFHQATKRTQTNSTTMTKPQRNSKKYNTMKRRAIQALAAAAFVVSAQAFSAPATSRTTAMSSHVETAPRASSSLSMIVQKEKKLSEFDIQLGKALDTLRKDYPYMLKRTPGKFTPAPGARSIQSNPMHIDVLTPAFMLQTFPSTTRIW
jgi:hypothetical protein